MITSRTVFTLALCCSFIACKPDDSSDKSSTHNSSDDKAEPDASAAPTLDPSLPGHGKPEPHPAVLGTAERGQYLVDHVLLCGVCHTPSDDNGNPDLSLYLAGSRSYDFKDVDGTIITVNAENLTSHDPEGLHSWTDSQIRRALTVGIDDEDIAIYPIMPYPEYSVLTPDDVDSIIKYLRTVPPNDNVVPADYPRFDQNPPAPPVKESQVPHTTLSKSDPDYDAAERGRYLATVACLNCHTEQITPDVPDFTKAFAGGKKYTFIRGAAEHTSVNLTPDSTGLGDWSVKDIEDALLTNKEKGTGRTFCNTHPGGPDRLGGMKASDRHDIAVYLHTLPPIENGPFQCEASADAGVPDASVSGNGNGKPDAGASRLKADAAMTVDGGSK